MAHLVSETMRRRLGIGTGEAVDIALPATGKAIVPDQVIPDAEVTARTEGKPRVKRANLLDLPLLTPTSQLDLSTSGLGAYRSFRRYPNKSFPVTALTMPLDRDDPNNNGVAKVNGLATSL
jgi:hypothetical protein